MFAMFHENLSGDITPGSVARALRAGASHSYQFVMDQEPMIFDWQATASIGESAEYSPTMMANRTLTALTSAAFHEAVLNWDVTPTVTATRPGETSHRQTGVLTSSSADSPVKIYPWPETGPVLGAAAAGCSGSLLASCANCGHDGRSLKMSPDFYLRTTDVISRSSSTRWANAGSVVSPGRFWMRDTSESRNAAAACSLSAVLLPEVPSRYWLSAKAARGILRRQQRRGKPMPPSLLAALTWLVGSET